MSMFTRRFLVDPGTEVLLEIESVNILDLNPPASIVGVGTGTVLYVGEAENGPYNDPTEVFGATDMQNTFGLVGYTYNGVAANNPSARVRKADGALVGEPWNGSLGVQLNGKKFRRLIIARADTSVGQVQFSRQATITGGAAFAYNLEPAQILALDIGAGAVNATFSATAAVRVSGAGVYPTLFVGGETLTLGYDSAPNFVVTFLAADQTKLQVIARINQYAGFSFASDGGGNIITLTSIRRGLNAQVRVVAASAGVLVALGMTVGTTMGTGNVGDIDAVTFLEIKTVVQAAVAGTTVEQDSQGRLRISKNFAAAADYISVGSATTATGLGFAVGLMNSNDGFARLRSGVGVYPTTFVGGETLTLGVDDEPNFVVVFTAGDQTQAAVITRINLAAGFTMATSASATVILFAGRKNAGQVRILGASVALVLTALGLTVPTTVNAGGVSDGVLPAGTVVQNAAATNVFVTTQDVEVTALAIPGVGASGTGPYPVFVRHALDDGTGISALAGTLVSVPNAPDLGSFAAVNAQTTTAALTEAQIDAQYQLALDSTIDMNSIAKEANIVVSARQSNAVRRGLKTNAVDASARGMFGRMAVLRPPLGTAKAVAKSGIAEPGVGAYRNQRAVYCYPAARTFVPVIARRGIAGGTSFTADGLVDVGADGFMASILSQLAPEEDPGQQTDFLLGVVSLESSPNAANLQMEDYVSFKKAGIAALRIDGDGAFFQSGVTSVDPASFPELVDINRRRMADFIQDTLARRLKTFGKKLSTEKRRKAIVVEIRGFMNGLLPRNNPDAQRIAGFSIDLSANTQESLAMGIFRIILNVRTLASLKAIVLQTVVGTNVDVSEVPLALAA